MVTSLELLRQSLEITALNIIGHSLGSLFSIIYAAKYPQHVNSIIALSLPCVMKPPEEFDPKKLKLPLKRKLMKYFWTFMNKKYITGHTAFSMMPMRKVISYWLNGRVEYKPEEKKPVCEFLCTKLWDPNYGSDIIPVIMGYLGYSKNFEAIHSIKYLLEATQVKLKLIYGETDWIPYREHMVAFQLRGIKVAVEIIPGATHNLPNTISEKVTEAILESYRVLGVF